MEKLIEAFSMFADLAEKYDVDIAFLMMHWNFLPLLSTMKKVP